MYREGHTLYTIPQEAPRMTDTAPSSGAFLLVAVCAFIVAVYLKRRGLK